MFNSGDYIAVYYRYRSIILKTTLAIPIIIGFTYLWIGVKRDLPRTNSKLTPENAVLIFVGGHESSGTGLMRIMLDAHPQIRCGGEPVVTRQILQLRHSVTNTSELRLRSVGVYPTAYDNAVAVFILKIIEEMGPPAKYLCHKEPTAFIHLEYLARLFPRSKFIHMLRDGRAVIASTIIRGFKEEYRKEDPYGALKLWETTTRIIQKSCQKLGSNVCITIRYEDLVMRPKNETLKIFEFLGIQWDPIILKHETILNQLTSLSPYEPSTIQFSRKIHNESLYKWANPGYIFDEKFLKWAERHCVLLRKLGYAGIGLPPNYTRLPPSVPIV